MAGRGLVKVVGEFSGSGDPWEDVSMPEGFDPKKNVFLNPPKVDPPKSSKGLVSHLSTRDDGIGRRIRGVIEPEKTQDEWIEHWSSPDREWVTGEIGYLASMPDYYKHFKMLAAQADEFDNLPEEARRIPREVIRSLIQEKTTITSTRIVYDPISPMDVDAEIFHLYKSPEEREVDVLVPDYQAKNVAELASGLDTGEAQDYLQALFETDDGIGTIHDVIKNALRVEKVYLWTPNAEEREKNNQVAATIYLNADNHLGITFVPLDQKGHSFPIEYTLPKGRPDLGDLSAVDDDFSNLIGGKP